MNNASLWQRHPLPWRMGTVLEGTFYEDAEPRELVAVLDARKGVVWAEGTFGGDGDEVMDLDADDWPLIVAAVNKEVRCDDPE